MTAASIHNDPDIVRQFAAGDEYAFRFVFREYFARLVFFAQRHSITREEAEDAVMETFTRSWVAREQFTHLPGLRSYLFTVTRNVVVDITRKKKRLPQLTFDDAGEMAENSSEEHEVHAELTALILQEIDKLPEKCREVVILTYRDGLSTKEIAERLNISVSNVTSQRSRAMSLLKMAFADRSHAWVLVALMSLLNK